MWSSLIAPFVEFDFLRTALLQATFLGFGFSLLGTVLITRRLSLIGDTLSHAMLPGVVVSFLIFGPDLPALFLGGWVTGFLLLLLSSQLLRRGKMEADSALALFAVFSVAVGLLIASRTQTTTEILHLLLGNILATDGFLLTISAILAVIAAAAFFVGWRSFLIGLVDPEFFFSVRKPGLWITVVAMAFVSAQLTVGFASMGAMMTVGLLIVPALTARELCHDLRGLIVVSTVFSFLASWLGLALSYAAEVPPGPAIVAVACLGLAVVKFLKMLRPDSKTEVSA